MTADGLVQDHSAFRDLNALARRLSAGQVEASMLQAIAPLVPSLTMGWTIATVLSRNNTGPIVAFGVAAFGTLMVLLLHTVLTPRQQAVLAVLVAIGASAAVARGISTIVIPSAVGVVAAAVYAGGSTVLDRSPRDPCVLVVPLCATAMVVTAAARIEGWTPLTAAVAFALGLEAVAAAASLGRVRSFGVTALLAVTVALGLTVVALGWPWARISVMVSVAATVACVLLLSTYHLVAGTFVQRTVSRDLTLAVQSAADTLFDELHETVISRLNTALMVARRSAVPEVEGELRAAAQAVREFRGTGVARPDARVDAILDAVWRPYRSVISIELPTAPTDTAIELAYGGAVLFRRVVAELLSNVVHHATGVDGRAVVVVTASRDERGNFTMDLVDDGPGLARVPARGSLADVVAQANTRRGWLLVVVPGTSGAHFRLTIDAEEERHGV